jgi:hypothetical protein
MKRVKHMWERVEVASRYWQGIYTVDFGSTPPGEANDNDTLYEWLCYRARSEKKKNNDTISICFLV